MLVLSCLPPRHLTHPTHAHVPPYVLYSYLAVSSLQWKECDFFEAMETMEAWHCGSSGSYDLCVKLCLPWKWWKLNHEPHVICTQVTCNSNKSKLLVPLDPISQLSFHSFQPFHSTLPLPIPAPYTKR